MNVFKCVLLVLLIWQWLSCGISTKQKPVANATEKPWSYWWWMGSSVTKDGITENLRSYHQAGIGGMHIIPIYGEKGDESNYIDFLSPHWMDMLVHTLSEAEKLGMGIDMTMGTGWPYGGPDVTTDYAAKKFKLEELSISQISTANENISGDSGRTLVALAGIKKNGLSANLTHAIQASGDIRIDNIEDFNKIIALVMLPTGQNVKRAAPGGEGLVLDYFNKEAIDSYFSKFENVFDQTDFPSQEIRSFYHDSYEVYGANFTNNFLQKFHELRGYDLVEHLNVLVDTTHTEIRVRIVSDFCETISDLLFTEFTENWVRKCHTMGMMTRNQAHGSPGNILDLYGASDIPETESFGVSPFVIPGVRQDPDFEEDRFGRPNPLAMKFASSPAHLMDKKLVSSETATWLGDHFKVALSQVKPQIDELFTAGINHIFYHGITYSPPKKPFPGRVFYASTNFGPHSHFWQELPALNQYITRCQSILQSTKHDNDVLIYFPIHDLYASQDQDQIIRLLTAHHTREWLEDTPFGDLVTKLWNHGFSFDYISDKMLERAIASGDHIRLGSSAYQVIIVPQCSYFPEKSLQNLLELAKSGGQIIFCETLPATVNGFSNLKDRLTAFSLLKKEIQPHVVVTKDPVTQLKEMDVRSEDMALAGLNFIRKRQKDGLVYFVTNLADTFEKGTVTLATRANNVQIFDPLSGKKGLAKSRRKGDRTEILLHLRPGESRFLYCYDEKTEIGEWTYWEEQKELSFSISSAWTVTPTEGSPALPSPLQIKELQSWTNFGADYSVFSGKVHYTASFELDDQVLGQPLQINLGDVRETAKPVCQWAGFRPALVCTLCSDTSSRST